MWRTCEGTTYGADALLIKIIFTTIRKSDGTQSAEDLTFCSVNLLHLKVFRMFFWLDWIGASAFTLRYPELSSGVKSHEIPRSIVQQIAIAVCAGDAP